MKKYLKWDLIVPLLFLVGGLLWLQNSMSLQQSENLSTYMTFSGPSTFPNVVLTVMCVCSAIVVVQEFLKLSRAENTEENALTWKDYGRVIILMAGILVYILVMPTLGFIIPTMLLVALCMALFGEKNVLLLASVSIVAPLAVFFLFKKILAVPLPTGPLF